MFVAAARRERIPLPLLVSVASVESRFDENALSRVGAIGLLQLLPSTPRVLGLNPHNPSENILGGATFLRQMLDQFGSTEVSLAAYNAGPNAVRRGTIGTETLRYVTAVMRSWESIRGCY